MNLDNETYQFQKNGCILKIVHTFKKTNKKSKKQKQNLWPINFKFSH